MSKRLRAVSSLPFILSFATRSMYPALLAYLDKCGAASLKQFIADALDQCVKVSYDLQSYWS